VKLSNEDSIIANQIEIFLLEAKFNLQSPVKVYPQNKKKALNILYLLRENGLTVQVNNDLWMHRNCYEILKSNLRLYFKKNNKLSVPDFKGILNVTRKNAIPLLEYLDKINFTKRVENYRIEGASLND
jgi:selenocysteine-specific elongation factor